jgi:hypothetical protein
MPTCACLLGWLMAGWRPPPRLRLAVAGGAVSGGHLLLDADHSATAAGGWLGFIEWMDKKIDIIHFTITCIKMKMCSFSIFFLILLFTFTFFLPFSNACFPPHSTLIAIKASTAEEL